MIGATPLEANAAKQIVAWIIAMFDPIVANWNAVSTALAAGLVVYLVMVLYERFQSDEDPSYRKQVSTGAGSVSFLWSAGAGVLAGVLAVFGVALPAPALVALSPIGGLLLSGFAVQGVSG